MCIYISLAAYFQSILPTIHQFCIHKRTHRNHVPRNPWSDLFKTCSFPFVFTWASNSWHLLLLSLSFPFAWCSSLWEFDSQSLSCFCLFSSVPPYAQPQQYQSVPTLGKYLGSICTYRCSFSAFQLFFHGSFWVPSMYLLLPNQCQAIFFWKKKRGKL